MRRVLLAMKFTCVEFYMRRVLHAVSLYFDEFFSTSFSSVSIVAFS